MALVLLKVQRQTLKTKDAPNIHPLRGGKPLILPIVDDNGQSQDFDLARNEVMSAQIERRYYTEKEFCELFNITRKTAGRWRKQKAIGFMRTPTGLIRYRQSDIDEYERRTGSSPRKERRQAA